MSETKVVHIREAHDVRICRTKDNRIPPAPHDGCFGNPFFLRNTNDDIERAKVIAQYREYFYKKIVEDNEFKKAVLSLRGKRLACFCAPKACHGDIIKEYLGTLEELEAYKFNKTKPYFGERSEPQH